VHDMLYGNDGKNQNVNKRTEVWGFAVLVISRKSTERSVGSRAVASNVVFRAIVV